MCAYYVMTFAKQRQSIYQIHRPDMMASDGTGSINKIDNSFDVVTRPIKIQYTKWSIKIKQFDIVGKLESLLRSL